MNDIRDAPDTIEKIFPEVQTLEEKALLLFELKDSGASFRKIGRALKVHHQSVAKLYRFLVECQVYADYTWEKNEQVKDFLSKDFFSAIHEDYKKQRKILNDKIDDALKNNKDEKLLDWLKEKRLLMKDMVATALSLTPADKRGALDPANQESQEAKDLEAKSEENPEFTKAMDDFKKMDSIETVTN